ncbi:MAG: cation-transporting P-type ATPase, partial [Clostridia bacterium]|nr:cation-transporting P-type ATPase [Clostridia bacterium]
LLKKLGAEGAVRVIRGGVETVVKKEEVVVGDIMILEAGDKVCADGRIISCVELTADESMLTGESKPTKKSEGTVKKSGAGIADISNMLFSGTFVSTGKAKILVTGVGDKAETGKLAEDVLKERTVSAPLEEKLSRLGRLVTICGAIAAAFVFLLSIVRLYLLSEINFFSVENAFIEAIVLIVAAVPEGLPTTVAISLTLNVVKLAKSNALIKKLVATETVGCVSVICSDKTGTLTQNKMLVDNFVIGGVCYSENRLKSDIVALNCAVNSTAIVVGGEIKGSATEGALLSALAANKIDYTALRNKFTVTSVVPFSSDKKYMKTAGVFNGEKLSLLKGAPEVVLKSVFGDNGIIASLLGEIADYQKRGKRVIAFSHEENGKRFFDGFAVISDRLRQDVKRSVAECREAGVSIKILTGDGIETARSVAAELKLPIGDRNVVTADMIDGLSEDELIELLPDISVIARSTPRAKLRIVKALQAMGEVVAVTGDGVNDAPAIKHADIGIAMGSGSEITKEASDIVLLDNSFSTIITAISFGRNIYSNFQRFIMFQLNVNLASMSIIIAYLLLGFKSPFTSVCLLWLNVIMDGPLALS